MLDFIVSSAHAKLGGNIRTLGCGLAMRMRNGGLEKGEIEALFDY